jgi:PfaD family protein
VSALAARLAQADGQVERRPAFDPAGLMAAASQPRETAFVVRRADGALGIALGGEPTPGAGQVVAMLAPMYPEWLGDRAFTERHGLRFPYIVGEMARGIAGTVMVIAAGQAGLLGFFGAAGLPLEQVAQAIGTIERALAQLTAPWGVNIIHRPADPEQEHALVDLLLARRVVRASASAFLQVTDALVHYAAAGLQRNAAGKVVRRQHLFAKVSRPEVARAFLEPASDAALQRLQASGRLSAQEAALARTVPLVQELTVEADSGGHTDGRPLAALLPVIQALAHDIAQRLGYEHPVLIGAAGGIGTPGATASAFALGAAYVLTGSINQATREAVVSDAARSMLAEAGIADFAMAPSADMFELGAKVQVLRRGTLFAQRASQLHTLYQRYDTLEQLPEALRDELARQVFRMPLAQVWALVDEHLQAHEPALLARAATDGRVRMALVFRWYLGLSSRWPVSGDTSRQADYQLWAGPALGACNAWLKDSPLADVRQRGVAVLALNLLEGAAVLTRAHQFRSLGVPMPAAAFHYPARHLT